MLSSQHFLGEATSKKVGSSYVVVHSPSPINVFVSQKKLGYFLKIIIKMAIIERIITVCMVIILTSALLLIALYQIYKFSVDGGFQNSFSGRLLIAGICFNTILIAIIFYLIMEVFLLRRLIDKISNDLIEEEPQLTLKDRIFQTIRGRSSEKNNRKKRSLNFIS